MHTRIYFLDHLRTAMIFLVVLYHATFSYQNALAHSWIAVDPVRNDSIGLIGLYLDTFIMAILFFISGYFIPPSIQNKSSFEFVVTKVKRILLPWLVGVLAMIPLYKILFLASRGMPQEPWYTYFHWYHRSGSDLSYFHNDPNQHWLWFLPVLFLFQLVYLVLYRLGLSKVRIDIRSAVFICLGAGLAYSMLIAIIGLKGWTHGIFLEFQNERFLIYLLVFLLGSLSHVHSIFERTWRNKKMFTWANIALSLGITIYTVVAINLLMNLIDPNRAFYFISRRVDAGFYYGSMLLLMFTFLYIFLYIFQSRLDRPLSWMKGFNANSYYIYIVHMVVLGLITWILVGIHLPVAVKYVLLAVLTFLVSNLLVSLYKKVVKRRSWMKVAIALAFVIGFGSVTIPQSSTNTSETPHIGIHEAVVHGDLNVVNAHIRVGTDINIREPSGGSSPLITASLFGETEIVKTLLASGADPNFQNLEGSTALHTAAFFCRKEIVQVLLQYGADPSIKNNFGATALASVSGSFAEVNSIYEYYQTSFEPLGLQLDLTDIQRDRPEVRRLLEQEK